MLLLPLNSETDRDVSEAGIHNCPVSVLSPAKKNEHVRFIHPVAVYMQSQTTKLFISYEKSGKKILLHQQQKAGTMLCQSFHHGSRLPRLSVWYPNTTF
jgi:hypothetical protein